MNSIKRVWPKTKSFFIVVCALFSSFGFQYVTEITGSEGRYYGTEIFGWNPACIVFFAMECILLHRFLKTEVLKSHGRMILSITLGMLLGFLSIGSMLMYYGSNQIFDAEISIGTAIMAALGIALFAAPCFSELVGYLNRLKLTDEEEPDMDKTVPKGKKAWLYFLLVWLLVFICFVPLWLYWWPINLVYDASYQIYNYMTHSMSTHHPILHTLLLGMTYEFGWKRGNVNLGCGIYSLLQMLVLSGSFAFFMKYVYEKKIKRCFRIIILLSFAFNSVNAWFAVSTVKGVYSAAFLIVSLTFLLQFFDCESQMNMKKILRGLGFVVFGILSCLFRNNMVYAMLVAGVVIALLQKGWKQRLTIGCIFLVLLIGYKVCDEGLVRATHAHKPDTEKEKMSVPLSCLARAAIYQREKIGEANYQEICMYISEDSLDHYSILIADSIKDNANEQLLRSNKVNFLKLFVKIGIKCPGEYLESILGLTAGYVYPLNYPYFFTGTTKLSDMGIFGVYPAPELKNYLILGSDWMEYLYGDQDGRLRIPILGWCWRSTLYVWGSFFLFGYFIYRRDKRGLGIFLIPFAYLLTCFLAPVAWLRYIYINIATVPVAIYLCVGGAMIQKNHAGDMEKESDLSVEGQASSS